MSWAKTYYAGTNRVCSRDTRRSRKRLLPNSPTEYTECITHLNRGMARYIDVLGRAFSPDIDVAFMGSVELATFVGVPGREILKNKNDVDDFFLS